ncbi:acyclic terpene utilization AtuA family protein [Pseudomonas sp. 5P_3.1_Bac2]|uniref:acyclic terpene utilization AtuA family protein n=1 Tax=Pseudomonas sp. 5P_3.1_Bac2 TaxID=2971617 RepID=UPI0021C749FA|nr:acyclic terpene utilization AtuA family protein [Pseudomonas sp. 5P_3.1_Bac2]MCU1716398.1 DUF1446 domain-containing protein [Pseudomonas sp. 5P_3.1_Bac2]
MKTIRIGSGAGYAGDRIDPAVEIAEKGNVDYLVFECLAERTIALANQAKLQDPEAGYDPLLEARMHAVLPHIVDSQGHKRFKIISNMGAANPLAAIKRIKLICQQLGLPQLKIAAVLGDDVLEQIQGQGWLLDNGLTLEQLGSNLIAANAYLGIDGIVTALQQQADIVITGRVADPSLFLAPLVHEFAWSTSDWPLLGKGTVVGHLLECAGQLTGGYFADPGSKDVPDLAHLGFPIAEVNAQGQAQLSKVAGSGGLLSTATCTEQLLYEVHNPKAYLTPDVTADFSAVRFSQQGAEQVSVSGASGAQRPDTLKVTVGFSDGFIGEGQISYGGPNALARAQLARDIVLTRLAKLQIDTLDIRADLLGLNSLHGDVEPNANHTPWEIRLRIAAHCRSQAQANAVANEVESLYTNGPYGGGGAVKTVKPVLAVSALYLPRESVTPQVIMEHSA